MNFIQLENNIFSFIKNNFKSAISGIEYYNDLPLELDKYKKANQIFINFDQFDFEALTNMSDTNTISCDINVICRNGSESQLRENLLTITSELYDFFQNNRQLGNAVDNSSVETIEFFYDVSASPIIKAATITVKFSAEEMQ